MLPGWHRRALLQTVEVSSFAGNFSSQLAIGFAVQMLENEFCSIYQTVSFRINASDKLSCPKWGGFRLLSGRSHTEGEGDI